MFKDDYKKCNESVKADPVLVDKIIRQTTQKTYKKNINKRTLLQKVGSIAAAFLILISSITLVYNTALNKEFVTGIDNYNEVYTLIKAMNQRDFVDGLGKVNQNDGFLAGAPEKATADNSGNGALKSNDIDFSDTNLQVLGVQEADVLKTDGNYIYAVSIEYIYIIGVDGQNLTILSKIQRNTSEEIKKDDTVSIKSTSIQELYVTENRLVLIKTLSNNTYYDRGPNVGATKPGAPDYAYDMWYMPYAQDTAAEIYDISDRENPKYLNTLGQNGSYISSRMIGDVLYLVTNHYIYNTKVSEQDPSTYIPSLFNDEKTTLINPNDICIAPAPTQYSYLIVTGINANEPDKHVSTKSIFGSGSTIYSSLSNLYVAAYSYRNNKSSTDIIKFALDNGNIEVKATAYVPGNLLNQFSMDEYKGYFRICTTSTITETTVSADGNVTSWGPTSTFNNLYILNDDLKIVGKIEGLAKGETIYSVRFDGDTGYFVTFRRTDPLFTVDLKDPTSPKVLSALKIPGFSNYLHMYSENLLFGFGQDADPETGIQRGLKLSMFDVSDKNNVTEKHTLPLGENYYYSESQYNHKAILVAPDRNLIGIFSNATGEYLLFSYDEVEGFKKEATLKTTNPYGYYYGLNTRGFYIENYLYVYLTDKIEVYSLDTFEKLTTLTLYVTK